MATKATRCGSGTVSKGIIQFHLYEIITDIGENLMHSYANTRREAEFKINGLIRLKKIIKFNVQYNICPAAQAGLLKSGTVFNFFAEMLSATEIKSWNHYVCICFIQLHSALRHKIIVRWLKPSRGQHCSRTVMEHV